MASLAVNGGTPVRTKPFTEWPIFGKSDEDALINVLRSGAWGRVSGGKKNEELEERFAQYMMQNMGLLASMEPLPLRLL